jgi:eukaryotic-like serine/threonine-protein kinase
MPEEPVPSPSSEQPTLDRAAHHSADSFGRYKLLQRLGEGGMGEVWLAEQTEPVRRQVALKIIKAGMDSTQVVARFEAERQALALMDHPTIATVFDGGTTPQRRPYFAMEYVKGEPITVYCDRHRLSTKERLELFMQVCEGVQHAHQKGIIHRDLKPSNVLVSIQDDHPVSKIIDFGVAKATSQNLAERSFFTELGVLIGTPEYMSPEQAEMGTLDIDTRTDIYALGVLLYELLTGSLPFDRKELRQAGLAEIQRIIREKEPPRPSTRIMKLGPASTETAKNRQTEPRRLVSELRGDLDWITMRALEKDRTRRYQTANALAVDLRRHLGHEPVSAGPPNAFYRAGKFVRRHRLGVSASLIILVAIISGTVLASLGLVRARRSEAEALRQMKKATAINRFLQDLLFSAQPTLGPGRDMKVVDALSAAVPKIDSRFKEQPDVRAALQHTAGRTYADLGMLVEAEPLLQQSLALRRQLGDERDIAESLSGLGALAYYRADYNAVEALNREALKLYSRTLGQDSVEVAWALGDLSLALLEKGDFDSAERFAEQSLSIKRARLGTRDADVAQSLTNLGSILLRKKDLVRAEPLLREALAIGREVHSDFTVSAALGNLVALLRARGDYEHAIDVHREILELDRRVLGPGHAEVGTDLKNLGVTLMEAGRLIEAESSFREALAIYGKALPKAHLQFPTTESLLGDCLTRMKRYDEAEPLVTSSYARISAQFDSTNARTEAARARVLRLYEAWGKPEKAKEWRAKQEAQQ